MLRLPFARRLSIAIEPPPPRRRSW
jgi:hypothetical protein